MSRTAIALQVVPLLLSWAARASAEEEPVTRVTVKKPSCSGRYSLLRPEPLECSGPMDTDRPHLTDTPNVVPAGHVQLETELMSFATARAASDLPTSIGLMTVLAKVGIVPGVDLQVGYGAVSLERGSAGWSTRPGPDVFLRSKLNLFGKGGRVSLTLAPWLLVPTSNDHGVQGGGTFLLGAELPLELSLEANLGFAFEDLHGGGNQWLMMPSVALTRTIYGPVSAFMESHHHIRNGVEHRTWIAATGLLIRVGQRNQIDLGARVGLTRAEHPVTLFLGYSFLL
jgi:hypothetical protein